MTDLNATADRIVRQEVLVCLSSMVATLANAYGCIEARGDYTRDVSGLADQAFELCSPGLDFDEAARQAGLIQDPDSGCWSDKDGDGYATAHDACAENDIEPYEWEVFEHWAVSTWLAEKLTAAGERVDTNFAGLNVWARTTTGQAISMDAVIQRIAADIEAAR